MSRRRAARGFTLVEVMVAMAVLMIGAVGLIGMSMQGYRMNMDGRRITRATTLAQDLVNQIQLWDYNDPRLLNANTANDGDIFDTELKFEDGSKTPPADHGEADLTLGGAAWLGIPAAELQGGEYERYWNIAEPDDTNMNGTPDGKRITVIVRWRQGFGFRRVVLFAAKINPAPEERL